MYKEELGLIQALFYIVQIFADNIFFVNAL